MTPVSARPEADNARTPAQSAADQLEQVVADKPRLAPGVRLAGQMQESAFEQPPWLIERTGQGYVQVPRPLYDIAERADGDHSLQDIAQEVAQADKLPLSTKNVRQLIATQLIPNGVVTTSDGRVVSAPSATRSALAIARLKTIDPGALDGITRALQVLFLPPVLGLVLLAAAVVQGWFYFVHGTGASLHDAFYVPGFVLLMLTAIIVSAGFHELGHAAALRYAGGTPRAFGFGMYLMYPVFFTDVSDNYRLRRWARVRTDLAGFYFNLIFGLGIFGLYLLTHQEALLVVIIVMNFEIIRQLLPFVRLDGYWTLVDLTGIPDFFAFMGVFLRSLLAFVPFGKRQPAQSLPPLKSWARAIFIAYVVITIPALIVLFFLMVRTVPRVIMTAWDALGQQGQGFLQAEASGAVLDMAGAIGQAVLIALPVAGLLFSLYRLGTGVSRSLWRWSAGSRLRRGGVGLGGAALVVAIAAMWLPQFPWPGGSPSPLYTPDAFQPIGPNERLTVTDALTGTIVERTPANPIAPDNTSAAPSGSTASPAAPQSLGGGPSGGAQSAGSASGTSSGGAQSVGSASGGSSGGAQSVGSASGGSSTASSSGASASISNSSTGAQSVSNSSRTNSSAVGVAGAQSASNGGSTDTSSGGSSAPGATDSSTGSPASGVQSLGEQAGGVASETAGSASGAMGSVTNEAAPATGAVSTAVTSPASGVPAAVATIGTGVTRNAAPATGPAAVNTATSAVSSAATAVTVSNNTSVNSPSVNANSAPSTVSHAGTAVATDTRPVAATLTAAPAAVATPNPDATAAALATDAANGLTAVNARATGAASTTASAAASTAATTVAATTATVLPTVVDGSTSAAATAAPDITGSAGAAASTAPAATDVAGSTAQLATPVPDPAIQPAAVPSTLPTQ